MNVKTNPETFLLKDTLILSSKICQANLKVLGK